MAVVKYAQRLRWELFLILLVLQTIIAACIWTWQEYGAPRFGLNDPLLTILLPFVVLEFLAIFVVIASVTKPVKEIGEAVSYAYKDAGLEGDQASDLVSLARAIRSLTTKINPESKSIKTELGFSQSLLDNLPLGVVVLDAARKIIYHNKAAPFHGGGEELNIAFPENDLLDNWLDSVNEKSVSATHWWRRVRLAHVEDENNRQFFDVIGVYHQEGVDSIETILITIDRTEQYATDEDDLDFTALAAHELRGPITVIKGYLDVLRHELESKLNDDQRAFFERLDVSADRLTTYINNILNVSRYDRQHLQLHLKEENLSTIYKSIADDLTLRARTQHRMLNVVFADKLPTIAADRSSLSEVIVNLVDNAIKYSNEGGMIVVKAEAKDKFVEVTVQDNGVGIPTSLIGNLFEKFYRSHRSRENTVGTGLGLYISRAIVESHGGTISVRSDEGHGSTFSFTVPIYASVADKLVGGDNSNEELITNKKKYIKNHSLYRG